MGAVQSHQSLVMFLHEAGSGLLEAFPGRQVGRFDAKFLEQILSVVEHHGAKRLRGPQGLAFVGENFEASWMQIFRKTGFLQSISEVNERRLFAEKNAKEGFVQLHEIRQALSRSECDCQLVRHFAETIGMDVNGQVILRFLTIEFGHLLVINLVLM